MTNGLSARQTQILKALIDEYIETAVPVGSENLDKKYNLGVSPATIRNEMVALTKGGYLRQPHTSSGRIPSPVAMKFYIDQLMEEKQMSLADEVKAKEEIRDSKDDLDKLLDEATRGLAQRTKSVALAATDDGRVWHAGYANIFANPEFSDMGICSGLFSFFEEAQSIQELFFQRGDLTDPFDVLFGEELSWPELNSVGIVTAHFNAKGKKGALGVVGPIRLSYSTIVPMVRYFSNMVEEAANG
ncbi:MAG: Transcriptional regulator of heat shock protein [Candidatus Levybacteria bacterium GW2011_GWA1_39_32]|nr:MAG: Transcriptional regulator of heat shock protein [Candidatus Levybacteria bacterium GW2011_GWA1_39_32]